MRRFVFSLVAAAALMPALVMAAGFSTERWIAEGEKPAEEMSRNGMLSQLAPLLVPGMGEASVVGLLGEPQSRSGHDMIYELGVAPYGIDFEYFIITLDENGNLQSNALRRD